MRSSWIISLPFRWRLQLAAARNGMKINDNMSFDFINLITGTGKDHHQQSRRRQAAIHGKREANHVTWDEQTKLISAFLSCSRWGATKNRLHGILFASIDSERDGSCWVGLIGKMRRGFIVGDGWTCFESWTSLPISPHTRLHSPSREISQNVIN